MADYYEILEIDPDADEVLIRAAWKKRAQELHPDRMRVRDPGAVREAEQLLAQVNHAYQVLRDPDKRRSYDAAHRAELDRRRRWQSRPATGGSTSATTDPPTFEVSSVSLSSADPLRPLRFRVDLRQVGGGPCSITDLHVMPRPPWTAAMFRQYSFVDDNRLPPVAVEFEIDVSDLDAGDLREGDIELIVDAESINV